VPPLAAYFYSAQECIDRPVFAIDLGPEHTAILQLSKRLEFARTRLNRTQVGAADAGQVNDRRLTTGVSIIKRPCDGAFGQRAGRY
jgi:multidrug resistance efflux pump